MSGKLMEQAIKLNLPKREKWTLVAICSFHSKYNPEPWPSHETLAERSGLSRSAVYEAIPELEKLGLLTAIRTGGRTNNEYQITLEPSSGRTVNRPATGLLKEPNRPEIPSQPSRNGAPTVQPLDPNKVINKVLNKKGHFDLFWSTYPTKVKKKQSLEIWKRKNLDKLADQIIADVSKRMLEDRSWLDGYIPHPTTYLNGERWQDESKQNKPKRKRGFVC